MSAPADPGVAMPAADTIHALAPSARRPRPSSAAQPDRPGVRLQWMKSPARPRPPTDLSDGRPAVVSAPVPLPSPPASGSPYPASMAIPPPGATGTARCRSSWLELQVVPPAPSAGCGTGRRRSAQLPVGVSLLSDNGLIPVRPARRRGDLPPGCEVVDTVDHDVPHGRRARPPDAARRLTLDRPRRNPAERLLAMAESNGELECRSRVRSASDVGSAARARRLDGRWPSASGTAGAAVATGPLCRRRDLDHRPGALPDGLSVEALTPTNCSRPRRPSSTTARTVKLYLDGPDPRPPRSPPTRWPG